MGRHHKGQTDFTKPLHNVMREKFCQEYASRFGLPGASGADAARRAGYSARTARAIASELLTKPDVQQRIAAMMETAKSQAISTIEERKATLTEIHRGRLSHFGSAGADGFIPNVGPENINSAALGEVTTRVEMDEAGEGEGKRKNGGSAAFITRIKLRDPVPAIDLLNKMDGAYAAEKHEHHVEGLAELVEELADTQFGAPRLRKKKS